MKTQQTQRVRGPALFAGYFYGAAIRLMMCDNFSLVNTDDGGGVDQGNGPFVPSAQLRLDAIALLDEALKYANPTQAGQCNTLKARAYLYLGDFAPMQRRPQRMVWHRTRLQSRHCSTW